MAESYCIPDRLAAATPGEQLSYQWLSEALPPAYRVWHEPRVGGTKPDVVVFGPRLGLAVLEVKDWSSGAVEGLGGDDVFLREGAGTIGKTHPLKQAEKHVYAILDRVRKSEACVHHDGERRGRVVFPWACLAILPNMTRAEVDELGLESGHQTGAILTGDEVGSPTSWGLVGDVLVKRLADGFRVKFAWKVAPRMRDAVHATLFPETSVGLGYAGRARRVFDPDAEETAQGCLPLDTRVPLSEEQRRVALDLGAGHQVLQGVAGSGKSEVVAARARLLAGANPAWRILVLCYNLSLAAWLRARIFEGGTLQNHNLTVAHFHAWARDLLDRAGIRYARSVYEEEEGFSKLALAALEDQRVTRRWDAVIIDEGQDFTPTMTTAALAALAERSDSLLFAMDNAQRIYAGRREPLSSLGVQARGRTSILKNNRRSTAEINTFSRRFLWGDVPEGESIRMGEELIFVPFSSDRHGKPVDVVRCGSLAEQADWAAAQSQELLEKGCQPDEIAVLYMRGRVGPDGRPLERGEKDTESHDLVGLLRRAFRGAKVPLFWMAATQTAKADAPLDLGAVTLSTVHSFKGLEARAVILVGADQSPEWLEENLREKALLYVGMTRATDRLTVTWSNPDGIGPSLEKLV